MDFINKNKDTILPWYEMRAEKENIPLFSVIDNTVAKCTKSNMVREKHILEIEQRLTSAIGEAKRVTIVPLLRPSVCFWNCMKMDVILNKASKKYNTVLGYTITACPCGKLYSMELHALLKVIKTGVYIDLTTDYCSETEKWFIPIEEDSPSFLDRISTIKELGGAFYHSCSSHACNQKVNWKLKKEHLKSNLEKLDEIIHISKMSNSDGICFIY